MTTHPGTVVAVGSDVTRFAVGDAVFGAAKGAFAEYAVAAERSLAHKRENVSFEDASAIPTGGLTALQGLRDHGQITSGQYVLIVGASGGVGIYAVQIAKSFDTHVTAVCSAQNTDMVGDRPFGTYVRNLTPEGRMVSVGALGMDTRAFMEKMAAYKASSHEDRVVSYIAQVTTDDLVTLGQLLASEEVASVTDRTFPLEQAAQAMAMQGSKRIRGKVVLVINGRSE